VSVGANSFSEFSGNEVPPFTSLGAWSGFVIGPASGYRETFVCRHSSHITDV
jgi:hypothetical protein